MPSLKKRKIRIASEKNQKDGSDGAIDHKVEDGRLEETFLPVSQATMLSGGTEIIYLPEESNNDSPTKPPATKYFPKWDSFVSVRFDIPGVRVRLNLPNLVIPPKLLQPDEEAMSNLHLLLKWIGFEVSDRATLAFFALGSDYDIKKAAERFVNFYNLANTEVFKHPDRKIVQSMEGDDFFEGFAVHEDGTFGSLSQMEKFAIRNHPTTYYPREVLCYISSMVDLGLVRNGYFMVCNARNVTWRNFKPYEILKFIRMVTQCFPLKVKGRLVIDSGMYLSLARKVLKPMLKDNITILASFDEARRRYPHVVLPTSLTGLAENKLIKRLSAKDQLAFNFFIVT